MADTAVTEAPAVASPVKGKKAAGPKKPPSRPPTAEMVKGAIQTLKERGGSSLQAIKKYITVTYKVDADKLAPFIKKYLRSAVASGALVQTKGKGASGSFKLPTTGVKGKDEKKRIAKKPSATTSAGEKKPKAAVAKESVSKESSNQAEKTKTGHTRVTSQTKISKG